MWRRRRRWPCTASPPCTENDRPRIVALSASPCLRAWCPRAPASVSTSGGLSCLPYAWAPMATSRSSTSCPPPPTPASWSTPSWPRPPGPPGRRAMPGTCRWASAPGHGGPPWGGALLPPPPRHGRRRCPPRAGPAPVGGGHHGGGQRRHGGMLGRARPRFGPGGGRRPHDHSRHRHRRWRGRRRPAHAGCPRLCRGNGPHGARPARPPVPVRQEGCWERFRRHRAWGGWPGGGPGGPLGRGRAPRRWRPRSG